MEIFQLDDEGYLVNKQGYKVLSSDYFNNPQNASIRILMVLFKLALIKTEALKLMELKMQDYL